MNAIAKVIVGPKNIGFLLLNNFTLISFSSAIEPLRLANHALKEKIYTWSTFSEKGETVLSSDGININVDFLLLSLNKLI